MVRGLQLQSLLHTSRNNWEGNDRERGRGYRVKNIFVSLEKTVYPRLRFASRDCIVEGVQHLNEYILRELFRMRKGDYRHATRVLQSILFNWYSIVRDTDEIC